MKEDCNRVVRGFSAWKCFATDEAIDSKKFHGYLSAEIQFLSLTFQCSSFPPAEFMGGMALRHKITSKDETSFKANALLAIQNILPRLYLAITVNQHLVYSSAILSVTAEAAQQLLCKISDYRKSGRITLEEISVTQILENEHHVTKYRFRNRSPAGKPCWVGQLECHHPEEAIGIHIISTGLAHEDIADEILNSQFIKVKKFTKLPAIVPETLSFPFKIPYLPFLKEDNACSSYRQAEVQLKIRVSSRYRSWLGSLPVLACRPPSQDSNEVFRLGPNQTIRILSAELLGGKGQECKLTAWEKHTWSEVKEDLNTSLERLQLVADIATFWVANLYSFIQRISSWESRREKLLIFFILLPLISSNLRPGVILVMLSIGLYNLKGISDPFQNRISEVKISKAYPKMATSFSSKENDQVPTTTATSYLVQTLVKMALPSEIENVKQMIRLIMEIVLPKLIFVHCILCWHSQADELKWQCHHTLRNSFSDSKEQCTPLGFRSDPYFYVDERYSEPFWCKLTKCSSELFCFLILLMGILFIVSPQWRHVLRMITFLYISATIILSSPIGVILCRFCSACYNWLIT